MQTFKAPAIYSDPSDLTATATFQKVNLASIAGVTLPFSGSLDLLMANTGANLALFFLSVNNSGAAPAVNGMPLSATPANPILISGLLASTVLWYKSTAGTTIEIQVAKVVG